MNIKTIEIVTSETVTVKGVGVQGAKGDKGDQGDQAVSKLPPVQSR